ncbi:MULTISPECIES: hypothetical protein [Pseudomonas]|jgi:serine/threonine protein phosphatase PrpC|uniref:hypothetical protein n=1 Tax=Pseudomonas sp. MIL9 TaxID=2807620 RepID=UPI0010293186|nr:hypothetical protein [Pseudomonas sp. MIL9]RZO02968.1 hypothetical protein EKG40_25675 [Pseudomonas moorei]
MSRTQNIQMLEVVAKALGEDLCQEVAFVGGCTTALLLTDEFTREDVRYTDDVDLVVHLTGYAQWQTLVTQLKQKGFTQSPQDEVICRLRLGELLPDAAISIHEGDCCLGVIDQDSEINWLSAVHCAPNWQRDLTPAQIALDSSRHCLTRCFSARRPSNPEINVWPARPNRHWLLASDGFWAGLCPRTQPLFLRDGHVPAPPTDDDISCLSVIAHPIV